MGLKTLTAKMVVTFATMDLFFVPIVDAGFLQILGVGISNATAAAMFFALILKIAGCVAYITSSLRDYEIYAGTRTSERTPELLRPADESLRRLPDRVGLCYSASWAANCIVGLVVLQTSLADGLYFNSALWNGVAIVALGVAIGSFAMAMPLTAVFTAAASGECSLQARRLGVALPRAPESLQFRIAAIALVLGLGPTVYSTAPGYMKQVDAQEAQNALQAELLVTRLSERFDSTASPADLRRLLQDVQGTSAGVEVTILDRTGRRLVANTEGEVTTPTYAGVVLDHAKAEPRGVIRSSGRSERIAYQRLEGGTIATVRVDVPSPLLAGYLISAGLFVLVIGLWAPFCAVLLGRAVTNPIERLTATTEKIVEEGKQSEIEALPVIRNDEVGHLSSRFNDLLDVMKDLSRAADAIAAGELRVEIARKGELPDAFRRMLDGLRAIVREIRGTSVELASAATEILAASQEQESAATSQSSAMEEISRTMESLSASAAHVSESVQGVFSNAEQTLSTTDRMMGRIGELSGHANRIGEILDVIKEIADRSDLLALNGSLEASRAGESGHGFALVAAEMRRLAERVSASVEDVKRLVSDIRDSGSSTVAATEEGRRLADGTTEAARQITFVTQQQRSGTEQVSESIRNITDVVTQAVSATAQTRTSAQGLKTQADRLAALVKRFALEPSEAQA